MSMDDYVKILSYGGVWKRSRKIQPLSPNQEFEDKPKDTLAGYTYWTTSKKWSLSKNVKGFSGRFTMGVDVIYSRRAYQNPDKCILDLKALVKMVKGFIGCGEHYIYALEYGEGASGFDMFEGFKTSSTTPHYHGLLTKTLTPEQQAELVRMVEYFWCFDSINFDVLEDDGERRNYVIKPHKFKLVDGHTKKVVVKGDYPSASWCNVDLPTHKKSEGYLSLVKPEKELLIDSDLMQLLSGGQYTYHSRKPFRMVEGWDGVTVDCRSIDWSSYNEVEQWFIARRYCLQCIRHKGLSVDKLADKLPSGSTIHDILNYRKSVIAADNLEVMKWFDQELVKINWIPEQHKDKYVYTFDDWITIKRKYFRLKEEMEAQRPDDEPQGCRIDDFIT